MDAKFSLRDFIVYVFSGLITLIMILLLFNLELIQFIATNEIKNEGILSLIILLICYIIGQLIFCIDTIVFNNIISREKREYLFENYTVIHRILFGYRIKGIRDEKHESHDAFLENVAKIRNKKRFKKANRYDMLNDSMKGFVLIFFLTFIMSLFTKQWYYPLISLSLMIIFYIRARKFAKYYVEEIQRQTLLLND